MAKRKENEDSELSRREVIKLGAGAAIGATIIGAEEGLAQTGWKARKLLFFTKEEFALVDELSELIIPADDHSPGARAAEAAAFIDFRLSESWDEAPKKTWRDGLKLIEQLSTEMTGKSFLQSTPDQRIALLTRISQNEQEAKKPEEKFFVELKSRTVHAYYTSKIGMHKEMEYKGNTSQREYSGYDAK